MGNLERKTEIKRNTSETKIEVELNLDGKGTYDISTGNGFFDHMMELFSKHGLFDLKILCEGDTHIDMHHSVEDIGICLGKAFDKCVGDKTGIKRYGLCELPMDESLAKVVVDMGGRPFLVFNADIQRESINGFDVELAEEFFRAVSVNGRMNIHVDLLRGENAHHSLEAIFKAFAKALDQATSQDERSRGNIPSTKGCL